MKNKILVLSLLSIVLFSCGPVETTETAIKYSDEMMDIQANVDNSVVGLIDAIDSSDEEAMNMKKVEALKEIENAEKLVNGKENFDKKDDYKKEMLKLLGMYKSIVNEEMSELIDMTLIYDELNEDEVLYYENLSVKYLEKYDKAFAELEAFQKKFNDKWNLVTVN